MKGGKLVDYEKIGKFIYQLRKEKKLTQKDLAESLSVTIQAISKWERGLGCPDVSLLRPLSEELGVSISELLNGEKIKKENVLEKVDDLLMKNLEENQRTRKKDRLIFLAFLIGIILIFYSFTLNIYTSFRLLAIITITLITAYIPIIVNKKTKLWHIAIPFLVFGGLLLFDYIAVSIYHREPIIYYNIEDEINYSENNYYNYYKRYDSLFYTAYKCSSNEVYELGPKNKNPNNYCFTKYDHTIIKSASITSKEGYVYFLGIGTSYEKNYVGYNTYFIEGFDLSTIYESDYMKEQISFLENHKLNNEPDLTNEEREYYKNRLVPHGDNDLSYAPKDVYDDLKNLQYFLNEKQFNKKITLNDLKDLTLSVITKNEIVELFNEVIDNGHNGIQYEINRKIKNVNNTNYEIVYMLEDNKITHVKINIKNNSFELDNDYLKEIENKIVEGNSFKIKNKISIKNNYQDLINILDNITL